MTPEEIEIPEEVRQRYLDRRRRDIECLRSALDSGTFDEFKRIGHQLKGNAASFGYNELESLAVQMEAAAVREDLNEAARQLDLFENWLKTISGPNGVAR